jgi:hypothetical protein
VLNLRFDKETSTTTTIDLSWDAFASYYEEGGAEILSYQISYTTSNVE